MTTPIESQALVVAQQGSVSVSNAMRLDDILAQVKLIQDVMHRVMKEKEHYGTIPGCGDKKTLLQPGAQKLTMTFRLAPSYDIQETDLGRGHKEYRVSCTLKTIQAGSFVGQGVGCCSTMESKYRWRQGSLKCPECGKETIRHSKPPKDNWYCWSKLGGCGRQFEANDPGITKQEVGKVENDNPADCYNTVLKIAKKRAFVDATITATAASDIFTQDIGDDEGDEPAPKSPVAASSKPQDEPEASFEGAIAPKVADAPKPASMATERHRAKALAILQAGVAQVNRGLFTHYLIVKGWILPTEDAEDWPLDKVPTTKEQFKALDEDLAKFELDQREGRTVTP